MLILAFPQSAECFLNMLKRVVNIACLSLISSISVADDGDWSFFTRAESFSYSAANPVTAYIDFLIGPAPDNGELAFSRNIIETGIAFKAFEFSLLHRNDYNLYFSRDAAEFAYLNKNRKAIPYGQRYDVDVWANQYQASGAKLGFTIPFRKNFDVHVAYSHLYGTEAVSGYLGKDENGEGGHIAMVEREEGGRKVKALDGELHTDYYFVDDPLFRNKVDAPTGQGYAIDLGFTWQVNEHLTVHAMSLDLMGEIRWKNMPHITADATSNNFITNEDGSVGVVPSFQGRETRDNFTQDLTRRDYVKMDYRHGNFIFGYWHDRMSKMEFNRLSAGYLWGERWGVRLTGEVKTAAVELRLNMPVGDLYFTIDDPNLDYAHTLGFGWNLNFRF